MRQKIVLILLGCTAFVAVTVIVSILQTIVNGFLPNNNPDPPGRMAETAIERSKREYEQQVKAGKQPPKQPKTKEQTLQPEQQTSTGQTVEPDYAAENDPGASTPAQQTYVTPAPTRGPGNYDAPSPPRRGPGNLDGPPLAPPPPASGPGNLQ